MSSSSHTHIEVAVALPVHGTFIYRVPSSLLEMVSPGKRVLVPFGKRRVTGYVLGGAMPARKMQTKNILDVLDAECIFPSAMIPFFQWVSDYYFHPIGTVIKTALPRGMNFYDVFILTTTQDGLKAEREDKSLTPMEKEVLRALTLSPCRPKQLDRKLKKPVPRALIYALVDRGLVDKRRVLKGGSTKPRLERYVTVSQSSDDDGKLSDIKKNIIGVVRERKDIAVKELKKLIPQSPRHLSALEKKGLIFIEHRRIYRDPMGEPVWPDRLPSLTEEQQSVIAGVIQSVHRGFSAHLLRGVTGSGKTEVYLHVAAECINRDGTVIVLVPEIALITQMESRFRARFGGRVAVLHSGLSAGERLDQWVRIARGELPIAIGTRSAIFAPFSKVGLIIVDEEHDTSYKQETGLRYNARDLAVVRAKQNETVALLGSATPSVQSYHNILAGKFRSLELTRRVRSRSLPDVSVVDLRETRTGRGPAKFISPTLYNAMGETLARGEQVLLFLNRRGYAGYPVCGSCGESLRCKNCDIPLTLHKDVNAFKCHYCGFSRASVTRCPSCRKNDIKNLGIGTEKLEDTVRKLFPTASVSRMDRDTTSRKGSMVSILKGLRNRSIDVLVGTQMVTKGHDFPGITLVGIVCADLSLGVPDFRAGERTYQILAQVSGRAGRGDMPGRVILQTYNPDHFSIRTAQAQDYPAFFQEEIQFRKALNYPPFSKMVQLKISGKDKRKVRLQAEQIGHICQSLQTADRRFSQSVTVMGPIEAPLSKIAGRYRWQILLKGKAFRPLQQFTQRLLFDDPIVTGRRDVAVSVDVDPYSMT